MKSGTVFDNILITDDVEFAEQVGTETWGATKDPEKSMKEKVSNIISIEWRLGWCPLVFCS